MQQREQTPEELLLMIEKMKADLEHAVLYLQKLQQEKAKIKYTLEYNTDNYSYLKGHCGVIAIDYVKNISVQIRRLKYYLKQSEEDILKFEKNIEFQLEKIKSKQDELVLAKEKASKKIIQFRRKK